MQTHCTPAAPVRLCGHACDNLKHGAFRLSSAAQTRVLWCALHTAGGTPEHALAEAAVLTMHLLRTCALKDNWAQPTVVHTLVSSTTTKIRHQSADCHIFLDHQLHRQRSRRRP